MKKINKILFIMFIFLLAISFVKAYNPLNLVAYYSFEDNNTNYVTDLSGHYDLAYNSTTYTTTGINNNAITNIGTNLLNATISPLTSDYSVNFWIKGITINNQGLFVLGDNFINPISGISNNFRLISYSTATNQFGYINQIASSSVLNNLFVSSNVSNWNMITLTYNSSSNTTKTYANGNLINTTVNNYKVLNNMTMLIIQHLGSSTIDEYSIWRETLSQADITYINNTAHSYSSLIAAYEPTFEYVDICFFNGRLGFNDLCRHMYYNSTAGVYCPFSQTVYCSLGCTDNSSYYENLGISPIDMNYSGRCSINYHGLEICYNENDTKCNGTSIVQTCLPDAFNFLRWIDTNVCINSATCQQGSCYLAGESPPQPTPTCDTFINCLTLNQKYTIMIVTSIMVIIAMVLIMSGFGEALAGLLVGLLMSMIVSLTLTLIFNLSLLIPILYILIGGAIFAILMRKIFTGG
jgi:hypothetical protein